MCSIYGALVFTLTQHQMMLSFDRLRRQAGDRGRDGGRYERYSLEGGSFALLGNWRATPTPEVEKAPFQPYDGVVHNGTIANDKELGGLPGEVDSMVLPRILDRSSLSTFAKSLERVKGSYALAAVSPKTIFLACNYKPLYLWMDDSGTVYFSSMERHFEGIVSKWERPQKLPPYSAMDLMTGETQPLHRTYSKKAVVIASSGLDSTVTAAKLIRDGWEVRLLHFLYGCKAEAQEVSRIRQIAENLNCDLSILPMDLNFFGAHSTILDGKDEDIGKSIEGSEYAVDWVPSRNLLMLSHATAYAESNGYHAIALGNNLEEAGSYPDNEEEFTHLFNGLLPYATQNGYRVDVLSPVGHLMKREIVQLGLDIGAPLQFTWSCYRAGNVPCNNCGPCYMRKEAFKRCGVKDPVDKHEWGNDFWKGCKDFNF